ncbi:MAG: HAD family phosphatase [Paramuribaculum sp.]|nr:HAD family phosphatase [Paramuribaculum sp.]
MIKDLLFDLGGVIMDIRRSDCVAAFKALGMEDPECFLGEYVQAGPFGDLESGAISPEEFRMAIRKYLPKETTDEQIDTALNRFLTGIPAHRLEALRKLRKRYGIYMLSNTNPIMWQHDIKRYFQAEGLEREDYFDGMITSFEARTMKPGSEIFRYAIDKCGLNPETTLFIDDSQANLDAAEALGFATMLVPPGSEFDKLLKERGL